MEKAVIVTDIPANREIVGKCKCGIYISSIDPVEIIENAYANEELREDHRSKAGVAEKKIAEEFVEYPLRL